MAVYEFLEQDVGKCSKNAIINTYFAWKTKENKNHAWKDENKYKSSFKSKKTKGSSLWLPHVL